MSGSATKGHLGKTVFGNDKNSGREAISGGRKLQQDRFTSSIWQMQGPCQGQALTSGAYMFHTVLRSVARLSTSAVLPHDVEAVICKLYSHYTYAVLQTKISTNTPTKVIKRTGMLECQSVHNLKEFRVQKVRDQCRDKHLHTARTVSVSTCMHYPMYTISENVQLSAADLDRASLGTQACEERERERERGGGGLACPHKARKS